jgi:hypothetical protein
VQDYNAGVDLSEPETLNIDMHANINVASCFETHENNDTVRQLEDTEAHGTCGTPPTPAGYHTTLSSPAPPQTPATPAAVATPATPRTPATPEPARGLQSTSDSSIGGGWGGASSSYSNVGPRWRVDSVSYPAVVLRSVVEDVPAQSVGQPLQTYHPHPVRPLPLRQHIYMLLDGRPVVQHLLPLPEAVSSPSSPTMPPLMQASPQSPSSPTMPPLMQASPRSPSSPTILPFGSPATSEDSPNSIASDRTCKWGAVPESPLVAPPNSLTEEIEDEQQNQVSHPPSLLPSLSLCVRACLSLALTRSSSHLPPLSYSLLLSSVPALSLSNLRVHSLTLSLFLPVSYRLPRRMFCKVTSWNTSCNSAIWLSLMLLGPR